MLLMTRDLKSWALEWLNAPQLNYINGTWKQGSSDRDFTRENPANGTMISKFKMAGQEDVDAAVTAANQCFEKGEWRRMSMRERARILPQIGQLVRDHLDELAYLETLSNGKTLKESYEDDLPDCGDIFDYYAGWIGKHYGDSIPVEEGMLNYTLNEPVGVCGLISPWNFPLLLACWKLAPALATGNSVILKPSEYTPFTLIRLVQLIDEKLDLPKGLINLVLGDGSVGEMITHHKGVHKVSFTGSTDVGRKIVSGAAQSNLKYVTLELGGKSPSIFFEDTPNLEEALDRTFHVMFSQKGEKCSEPTRWFIHADLYDKAVEWIANKANAYKCGDPLSDVNQGAQCNQAQFDKIMRYIDFGKEDGGRLVAGGQRDTSGVCADGLFVRPTVFADCKTDMRIAQDEIFGPVLSVFKFENEDQVIKDANDTSYGLAAGLYTSDVSRAHRVAAQLDAGMIFINKYGMYDFTSPFGGFRQSGWGKEMAHQSLTAYTKTKSVWLKL